MADKATRAASIAARKRAQAAGYYVREGSYRGTDDDRLGRWYVGRDCDDFFRPYGAGYASAALAWQAAAVQADHDAADRTIRADS